MVQQTVGHQDDTTGQGTGVGYTVGQKKDPVTEGLFRKSRQLPDDFLQVLLGNRFGVYCCGVTRGNGIAEFFFIQAVDGDAPRKGPAQRLHRPAKHLAGAVQGRFR